MSLASQVTVDQAIERLNELLLADPEAMASLINCRVPCSRMLAEHPTCQVRLTDNGHEVGLLGVINAIFGVNSNGAGFITVASDDNGESFSHFTRAPNASEQSKNKQ